MASFLSIPFPAWLVGILFLGAMLVGFAAAMTWNAYHNAGKLGALLGKLDSGVDANDDEDDDEDEVVFTVLVKFKDGSEARWRDVTKWAQICAGHALELTTDRGCATIPLENALWIADEAAAPERLESKKSV